MNQDLSKNLSRSNKASDQVAVISTPKRRGARIEPPVLNYEYTDKPDPLALSQAYEILFEEVLRRRKSKKQ